MDESKAERRAALAEAMKDAVVRDYAPEYYDEEYTP